MPLFTANDAFRRSLGCQQGKKLQLLSGLLRGRGDLTDRNSHANSNSGPKMLQLGWQKPGAHRTLRRALEESTANREEPPRHVEEAEAESTEIPGTTARSSSQELSASLQLISPFFFWGTSMVAMKALSPHTAPLFVSAVRLVPAGMAILVWAAWDGRPQPKGAKAWLWILAFSLADATCFQGFLAEGLQRTSAGLGSVIIDSQPLSVALMASILFGERLTSLGYVGLLVGVFGLCLLEIPADSWPHLLAGNLSGMTLLPGGGADTVWEAGEWWMLLAAQSMAVGTVLVPYVSRRADPIVATGYHMILGGAPLVWLSAQNEAGLLAERLPLLTGTDFVLLAYISLLGSAASYAVFFLNASKGNLTALSSLTFLTPCFAAATGFLAFGETLTPMQLLGASITLGGVYFLSQTSRQ